MHFSAPSTRSDLSWPRKFRPAVNAFFAWQKTFHGKFRPDSQTKAARTKQKHLYTLLQNAMAPRLREAVGAETKDTKPLQRHGPKAAQSSRDPKKTPQSPSKRHGPKAARRSRDREEKTSPRHSKRHGPTEAFFEMSEKHPRTDILWSALVCFNLLEPEHVDLLFLLESEHVDVYTISYIMLIFFPCVKQPLPKKKKSPSNAMAPRLHKAAGTQKKRHKAPPNAMAPRLHDAAGTEKKKHHQDTPSGMGRRMLFSRCQKSIRELTFSGALLFVSICWNLNMWTCCFCWNRNMWTCIPYHISCSYFPVILNLYIVTSIRTSRKFDISQHVECSSQKPHTSSPFPCLCLPEARNELVHGC